MARTKVTLISAGVAELLDSPEVEACMRAEAQARCPSDLSVRIHHSRILRGGGYRAVADIVDSSPDAMEKEARTGRLSRLLGDSAQVRYVSKSGRVSRITAKQAANYRRTTVEGLQ